jgi:hypothetical protein
MLITKKNPITGISNTFDIPVSYQQLAKWEDGMSIQLAMPNLSSDEREFLITGITPESWDAIFQDDSETEASSSLASAESRWLKYLMSNDDEFPSPIDNLYQEDEYEYEPDAERAPFRQVKLIRGFTEIQELYNIIYPLGGMIIGGYARYCCSPNKSPVVATDVDVYCSTMEVFVNIRKALNRRTSELKVSFETANAISYTTHGDWNHVPMVQLVKPINNGHKIVSGDVTTIMENFDFTITRAYIMNSGTCLVDKDFMFDEERMFLRIKNIHCPISSTFRFMKYRLKGYTTGAREVFKLFKDWDNRDQEYLDSLETFLMLKNPSQKEIEEGEALLNID